MARDAVIVRFPGNPDEVTPRYAEGLRRFAAGHPETRPEAVFLGRSERAPNELVVVLLWPEGVSHGVLGGFLLKNLADLGLERPTSIDHLTVGHVGFEAIASLAPVAR